jgi:uncharacterized protein
MENFGLSREEVLHILGKHVCSDNLMKHLLASEAVMKKLAERLEENATLWSLIGLSHDVDFDETKDDMPNHTVVGAAILREHNVPEEYIKVIMSHNETTPGWKPRSTRLEHGLACSESITGLVVATALVMPDKKLSSVKAKSVKKRMKMSAFARNVDRSAIMECEEIGIPIADFCALAVEAMQEISTELGL